MRALVVRGGWAGHRPVEATELFLPFLEQHGYHVRVDQSPEVYADGPEMAGTDLVVQCVSMSSITSEQVDGLRRAVAAGAGLIGWHGGIVGAYPLTPGYLQLVGGQFAAHPSKEPTACDGGPEDNFLPHRLNLTDLGRSHPITAGLDD